MLMFRCKGIYTISHIALLILASIHTAGCSDAASKASKQSTLSVLDIFPGDGAKSISTNTAITAVFNQEIDAATFSGATFILRGNNKTVAGEPSYKNLRAQFKPVAELEPNTEYSVEITAAVKSQSGQSLGKSITWKFYTGTLVDSSAPSIVDTLPVADALSVSTNTKITASFNERINVAAISAGNFSVQQGDTVVAGTVQASEVALSFTPNAALAEDTVYTVTVQGIVDLAGNTLAAAKIWSFTVGKVRDTAAPILISSAPPSGTENLPAAFSITLQISESLDASTVTPNTVMLAENGGAVIFVTTSYLLSTNRIVVVPQKNLNYGSSYSLTLDGVTDAAGNRLAPTTISFKTELDSDGDLMPDSWEKLTGTDPARADGNEDPDNDKLVNLDEFAHGADPKNADTDGDGANDGDEVLQGRSPVVNEPAVLAIINDLILSD